MDAPAPAVAHLDIPSGVLYWVDAAALSKEFVVIKQDGNRQVLGSLNNDAGLTGLQNANVSKNPEGRLIIQWVKDDGSPGTTVSIEVPL
ncbi:hypothetical protein RSOL_344700, partial [Rhizoctonia solani AG-3 Rhs1AP]